MAFWGLGAASVAVALRVGAASAGLGERMGWRTWVWLGLVGTSVGLCALMRAHEGGFLNGLMHGQGKLITTDSDARVIEIPTPRWSTYDAFRFGRSIPDGAPVSTQERAYTSPIWYTPGR